MLSLSRRGEQRLGVHDAQGAVFLREETRNTAFKEDPESLRAQGRERVAWAPISDHIMVMGTGNKPRLGNPWIWASIAIRIAA